MKKKKRKVEYDKEMRGKLKDERRREAYGIVK